MNIIDVKTAIKIGDFVLKENHRNKIDIRYLPTIEKKILRDNLARVYIFTQDGIIKKIGGSVAKGGIRATMNPYITAMTGSPGNSRYILHLVIARLLENKSKVEIYMITSPKVLADVNGLFESKKFEIASFQEMENQCKNDFYSKEGRYPDWNFKENDEDYPSDLAKKFHLYHDNRLANK